MRRRSRREPQVPANLPQQIVPRDAVLVTGLPGSDKTTLVNGSHFPHEIAAPITFSDLMDEVLNETHGGTPLAQLWPLERERVQRRAAERLAIYRPDRLLVIDGHLIVPTPRGWERGVPPEVWSIISLVAIVIVHVSAQEMVRRREDQIDQPEAHRIEEISIRQSVVQSTAAYYAASLNRRSGQAGSSMVAGQACALHWIINAEGRQEVAERELATYIRLISPLR